MQTTTRVFDSIGIVIARRSRLNCCNIHYLYNIISVLQISLLAPLQAVSCTAHSGCVLCLYIITTARENAHYLWRDASA